MAVAKRRSRLADLTANLISLVNGTRNWGLYLGHGHHWTRDQKSLGFLIFESTPGTRVRHVVRGQGHLRAATKGNLC